MKENIKIPLPPKEIQEKIIDEIKILENKEIKIFSQINNFKSSIKKLFKNNGRLISVENLITPLKSKIIKIQRSEYQSVGKYPVVSQEKEFIIGYTNKENPIIDNPVITFGDHNCSFKYVDIPFFQGADGVKMLKPDINKILPKFFFHSLQKLKIENADKYMRHYGYLKIKKIAVPSLKEQQKIVIQILKVENQISGLNQELKEIKNQKAEALEKYL